MVLKRLGPILGYAGQKNEIVFSAAPSVKELTCYFGGDVQNFLEIMEPHKRSKNFMQWNILATASLLVKKFPLSALLVILPSRFEIGTFSCYDNFVASDKQGSPSHTPMSNAMQHLKLIIENSFKIQNGDCSTADDAPGEVSCVNLDSVESINLIGFSKGCVVLNQLIREFHTISTCLSDSDLLNFWKKVKNIYWLDGAHSGGKDTWVVEQSVLTSLASCNLQVHVHMSPYQVEDDRRPWIREECKAFVSGLTKAGSNVLYKVHFKDMLPCLENHFKILDAFKQIDD